MSVQGPSFARDRHASVAHDLGDAGAIDRHAVSLVADGYEEKLSAPEVAALKLTDDLIGLPGHLDEESIALLKANYSDAEIAELALGVGLFMGMSKVLIMLGLEPEQMEITAYQTPGSE